MICTECGKSFVVSVIEDFTDEVEICEDCQLEEMNDGYTNPKYSPRSELDDSDSNFYWKI